MVRVGDELKMVSNRLKDIIFLAERGEPVTPGDWEGYAKDVCRIIANQAHAAQTYLAVVMKE